MGRNAADRSGTLAPAARSFSRCVRACFYVAQLVSRPCPEAPMPKLGIPPSRFPDRQPIAELRLQTPARCRTSVRPPPSLRMTPPSLL